MRTGCVICARLESDRLPGKMLVSIAGRPMLWHIVDRIKDTKLLDNIIVATTSQDY